MGADGDASSERWMSPLGVLLSHAGMGLPRQMKQSLVSVLTSVCSPVRLQHHSVDDVCMWSRIGAHPAARQQVLSWHMVIDHVVMGWHWCNNM